MNQTSTPNMRSRIRRILGTLIIVIAATGALHFWELSRTFDISMTFHHGKLASPPVSLSLNIENEAKTHRISMQKSIDYPTAPSFDLELPAGQYTITGTYTDAKGQKTTVSKSIEISKDNAQMDIYF